VVPLADIGEVPDEALRDAQALVVTRVDEVAEDRPARIDAVA
jgi:hypothetical protein